MRYVLCGLAATLVHYSVLVFLIELMNFNLAAAANAVAASIATLFSYVGNRWFVFASKDEKWLAQISRFMVAYLITAFVHTSVLYIWSDVYQLNYTSGFVIATTIQLVMTFSANKFLVFTK